MTNAAGIPVSGAVSEEVGRFTAEQRRIARERLERANAERQGLLEKEFPPGEPGASELPTNQMARLSDEAPSSVPPPIAAPPIELLASREKVQALQRELKRVGCYGGAVNGRLTNDTLAALRAGERHLGLDGAPLAQPTEAAVEALKQRRDPLCTGRVPCAEGDVKRGPTCVAAVQPQQSTPRVSAPSRAEPQERSRGQARERPQPVRAAAPSRPAAAPAQPRAPAAAPAPAAPAPAGRPAIRLTM
jgi:peptidoglycan hydrolase-like protein with peptidoglycan-binding domain